MPKNLKRPGGTTLNEEFKRIYSAGQEVPETALVKRDDGTMQWYGVTLTPTRAIIPEHMDAETWHAFGEAIGHMSQSVAWWIGDWCVYGADRKYGDLAELARILGYEDTTVRQYAWVSRSVEPSNRLDVLSFAHHMKVASIDDPDLQKQWLQDAADNRWSVRQLDDAIRGTRPDAFDKVWRRVNAISRSARHLSQPERTRIAQELRRTADEIEQGA